MNVARLRHPLALVVALAALLVLPAVAAASPEAVIRDCSKDEKLDGSYSNADLRYARDHLPSDLEEYSSCREVIGAAIGGSGDGDRDTAAAAASDGKASQGENAARAGDRAELSEMAGKNADPGEITVGGDEVSPGSDGLFDAASASNGMPLPLILALVGLALLTIAGTFVALRSRIPLLARISLPSRVRFPRFRR
jgi:hypothetical protein